MDKTMTVLKHHLLVYTPPAPPAHPTVLRNLSRQQYVRESALLELKTKYAEVKNYHGKGILQNVGFGGVLMTRICLSSDPSVSMSYDGPIHRGPVIDSTLSRVLNALKIRPGWMSATRC
jgi:hypothetical protein